MLCLLRALFKVRWLNGRCNICMYGRFATRFARIDSRESFAIDTPVFIARQADSHESLEFPIRANHPIRANRANRFARIMRLRVQHLHVLLSSVCVCICSCVSPSPSPPDRPRPVEPKSSPLHPHMIPPPRTRIWTRSQLWDLYPGKNHPLKSP